MSVPLGSALDRRGQQRSRPRHCFHSHRQALKLGNHIVDADRAMRHNAAAQASRTGMFVVAGTNAGSCKIQTIRGTSTTPVTIVANVGDRLLMPRDERRLRRKGRLVKDGDGSPGSEIQGVANTAPSLCPALPALAGHAVSEVNRPPLLNCSS